MHKKSSVHNSIFLFHPFEVAFCGYSNSGKTTLISRLIKNLSTEYKIGYIKHDVHAFSMDHKGKDTFQVKQSGAHMTFISDPQHFACIQSGAMDSVSMRNTFFDSDFVFIEGYKGSSAPKIIVIDDSQEILKDYEKLKFENVVAFVGSREMHTDLPINRPYFYRDDIDDIKTCLLAYLKNKIEEIPLYGLVLAGGRSRRMQQDKSLLKYHGMTQVQHCFKLLSAHCDKVFVSNRLEQSDLDGHKPLSQIHDTFINIGPLGGILSAMTAHAHAAWLVMACDLPFVNAATIKDLIDGRNPFKVATSYQSTHDNLPEPLCAIYEPKSRHRLFQFLADGLTCPRKVLINSDIQLIQQSQCMSLDNINTPEEYVQAKDSCGSSRV